MPTLASPSLNSHSQLIRWTSWPSLEAQSMGDLPSVIKQSGQVQDIIRREFPAGWPEKPRKIPQMEICNSVVFCSRFWYWKWEVFFFFLCIENTKLYKLWSDLFFLGKLWVKFCKAILKQIKPIIKVIVERKPIDIDTCPFPWLETRHGIWGLTNLDPELPGSTKSLQKTMIRPNLFGSVKLRSRFSCCRKNYHPQFSICHPQPSSIILLNNAKELRYSFL